jgi:hypothetical protein
MYRDADEKASVLKVMDFFSAGKGEIGLPAGCVAPGCSQADMSDFCKAQLLLGIGDAMPHQTTQAALDAQHHAARDAPGTWQAWLALPGMAEAAAWADRVRACESAGRAALARHDQRVAAQRTKTVG